MIRRFRDLGMPLDDIQAVLSAPDLGTRNERITSHLSRLEAELGRTQSAVASLGDLLASPASDKVPARIEHRTVPANGAAAITAVVDLDETPEWFQGALGELYATLAARDVAASGAGGIFTDEVFTRHCGQVTIFVPCTVMVRPTGRVTSRWRTEIGWPIFRASAKVKPGSGSHDGSHGGRRRSSHWVSLTRGELRCQWSR